MIGSRYAPAYFVLAAVAGGMPGIAHGQDHINYVSRNLADEEASFLARGMFDAIDAAAPAGLTSATTAYIGRLARDANWRFWVSFDVTGWVLPAGGGGAAGALIGLRGTHVHGPHADDAANNNLPYAAGKAKNIAFGAAPVGLMVKNTVRHPAGAGFHFDEYGAIANNVTAVNGAQPKLSGEVWVSADHTTGDPALGCGGTYSGSVLGSCPAAGGQATYNAFTRTLSLNSGPIDTAREGGSTAPGFDARYAADSVRRVQVQAVALPYQRYDAARGYIFGPGVLRLIDPQGELSMDFSFQEIAIVQGQGSFDPPSALCAMAEQFGAADTQGAGTSLFLRDFADLNVLGMETGTENHIGGVITSLRAVTVGDLVGRSGGFTRNAQAGFGWTVGAVVAARACAADFNGDGVADFFDYLDFVSAYSAGDPTADFNRDGTVDFFDYLDFVAALAQGC